MTETLQYYALFNTVKDSFLFNDTFNVTNFDYIWNNDNNELTAYFTELVISNLQTLKLFYNDLHCVCLPYWSYILVVPVVYNKKVRFEFEKAFKL